MATLTVFDTDGKKVGTYDVDPAQFAPRINQRLLHDVVVMYQANRRQGSARTKNRSEVRGTGRKMYRQKGTGNARAGSRRSGVRRGGGHIFATRPRNYRVAMPRKAVKLATRMAIAAKIRDDQVVLVDGLSFDAPKTRRMAGILKALSCDAQRLLVATAQHDPNVYKSARNLPSVTVAPATDLNALDVLSAGRLLVTRQAMDTLKARANGTTPRQQT